MSPRCVVRPVCGGYSKGCGRFCRFPGRPAVIAVSDTSVLSCLAELGELSLLHRLYGVITVNVWMEERPLPSCSNSEMRCWAAPALS